MRRVDVTTPSSVWMGPAIQEILALLFVFLAGFLLVGLPVARVLRPHLAKILLRRGYVKWAMRLQHWGNPTK